jgi:photosystem II stability/assembly factor-like uncharacterized protein
VPAAIDSLLAGTAAGLYDLSAEPSKLLDGSVDDIDADDGRIHLILDGSRVLRGDGHDWEELASLAEHEASCLLASGGDVWVGSSEAHLYRLDGGDLVRVEAFESVPGRDQWFTPWGGPPTTRSLSAGDDGSLYVNVHVGGIPKSQDGGASWQPTLEIRADAHEVLAPASHPRLVLAATAQGLARSDDGGAGWSLETDGLANVYCRALALADGTLFLSAADGPRGGHAALYRRSLDGVAFERCAGGLPEGFERNINTHCVAAGAGAVAFGADGTVYASDDGGESWSAVAENLPEINCVRLS